MGAEGTWNVALQTPVGERPVTLKLTTDGGSLAGLMETPMGAVSVDEGTVDGDKVAWKATMPYGIVEFSGKVSGDSIAGEALLAEFGNSTWEGTRV